MKLIRYLFIALFLPTLPLAYNPFKSAAQAPRNLNVRDQSYHTAQGFHPSELLESGHPKPEVYTKAMLELKRLDEEPLCHRVAAQMLINNCQDLDELSENSYQLNSVHLQRHQVESFAASLALCDLERGRFRIPDACTPFTSPVLLQMFHEGRAKLEASPEQVGACLEALGQHHSHWNTWLSYRDKALLFCKAARIDIDKDQSILLHKQLAKVIKDLTDGMESDLRDLREKMGKHAQAVDSYFERTMAQADRLTTKFQGTFESLSKDVTAITSSLKSAMGSTGDVQRVLKNIFEMATKMKLEMAVAQEQAIDLTTMNAKSRMEGINEVAGTTEASVERLRVTVSSKVMYERIGNMSILLEDHKDSLEKVGLTAADVQEILRKTAASAKSWQERMSLGSTATDYLVLLGTSLTSLFAGNYGLSPSLARNAGLVIGGLALGQCINIGREWQWNSQSSKATAATHLAREWIESLSMTPGDTTMVTVPIFSEDIEVPYPHIEMA